MKILRSIAVAFSMYSKIPMPGFQWDSEDMKYHLIFFPWIGALIGGLEYLLLRFAGKFELPGLSFAAFSMVIPLVITGGFHVDGFMDTADAFGSWQSKEKRLAILKDPHIGAFAVIHLGTAGLVMFASLCMMDERAFLNYCFSFFLARCLSGICVVKGKKAKEEGLLHTEAKTAADKTVFWILLVELAMCLCLSVWMDPLYGAIRCGTAFTVTLYYLHGAHKYFGGVTGDLAGWFVVTAEVLMAFTGAIASCMR
ncbi:MAG: adenosylcobinamide-GDP ribazoletransferase [Lachnospiraceae bacterium]|nr:adenosylcobinamide-GDP ribazoletransferase [Lachnospiraceae bacterium]